MSAYLGEIRRGCGAALSHIEQNYVNTPGRKMAACVGVALTSCAVGQFCLGFPLAPSQYGQAMGRACVARIMTGIQLLPESLQPVNATKFLQCLPTHDSCIVRTGLYFGRMALSGIINLTIPMMCGRRFFH